MADSTVSSTSIDEESVIIGLINSEREQILQIVSNSPMDVDGSRSKEVLEKYALADRALLEALPKSDTADILQQADGDETVLGSLRKEVEALVTDLNTAFEKLQGKQEEIESLEKRIKKISEPMESAPAAVAKEPIIGEEIKQRIIKRFKEEKAQLKKAIAALLPEEDGVTHLLAQLVEKGLKEPQEYLSLEKSDGLSERVAMILQCSLFETHPDNPLMVRMVSLS